MGRASCGRLGSASREQRDLRWADLGHRLGCARRTWSPPFGVSHRAGVTLPVGTWPVWPHAGGEGVPVGMPPRGWCVMALPGGTRRPPRPASSLGAERRCHRRLRVCNTRGATRMRAVLVPTTTDRQGAGRARAQLRTLIPWCAVGATPSPPEARGTPWAGQGKANPAQEAPGAGPLCGRGQAHEATSDSQDGHARVTDGIPKVGSCPGPDGGHARGGASRTERPGPGVRRRCLPPPPKAPSCPLPSAPSPLRFCIRKILGAGGAGGSVRPTGPRSE